MAACGRYRRRAPYGAEHYITQAETIDPRQVTCPKCFRTKVWRRAMGILPNVKTKILRVRG